jgi:hypothetical protein
MILPAFDCARLGCSLAQIEQLAGPYDSKTDQTAQTDQRLETAGQFSRLLSAELTRRDLKLTSRTVQRLHSDVQVIGSPLRTPRPSGGAQQP